jgi:hypothetical protein
MVTAKLVVYTVAEQGVALPALVLLLLNIKMGLI